jgi:hypothetical protein
MRKVYGKSMVEGAPLGNKNASGPHHSTLGSVNIKYPYEKGNVSFTHYPRGGRVYTKDYKAKPKSLARLTKTVWAMTRSGKLRQGVGRIFHRVG